MTRFTNSNKKMEEVIIIGSGIAGLTAGVYAARAGRKPLIITGLEEGGQLMLTSELENFPGIVKPITGPEFMEKVRKQAERFGTRFKYDYVKKVNKKNDHYEVVCENETIKTRTVIISTGASPRTLKVEGEEKYFTKGVHTCATCDGYFYKNKKIFIVGGGDSAMEEALFLSKLTNNVTIIHRREEFKASKIMQQRVFKNKNIKIKWNTIITEFSGDDNKLTSVKLKNTKTGEEKVENVDGVFLAIGHVPNTELVKHLVELDDHGYIKTKNDCETNQPGLYAAGDVQDPLFRQAVTAAASGCKAAMLADKYLNETF